MTRYFVHYPANAVQSKVSSRPLFPLQIQSHIFHIPLYVCVHSSNIMLESLQKFSIHTCILSHDVQVFLLHCWFMDLHALLKQVIYVCHWFIVFSHAQTPPLSIPESQSQLWVALFSFSALLWLFLLHTGTTRNSTEVNLYHYWP